MILREVICEEVGEGIILKKDENGKVIGIEVLYFSNEDIPWNSRPSRRPSEHDWMNVVVGLNTAVQA